MLVWTILIRKLSIYILYVYIASIPIQVSVRKITPVHLSGIYTGRLLAKLICTWIVGAIVTGYYHIIMRELIVTHLYIM